MSLCQGGIQGQPQVYHGCWQGSCAQDQGGGILSSGEREEASLTKLLLLEAFFCQELCVMLLPFPRAFLTSKGICSSVTY